MKFFTTSPLNDLLHLFFPHNCAGCGSPSPDYGTLLCAACSNQLPETSFLASGGNSVEKIFYGRIKMEQAGSAYFFTKGSLMQYLFNQLKYRGNKDAGLYLGRLLGHKIKESGRFEGADCILPVPLNEERQYARGYNQSVLIAQGVAEVWPRQVVDNAAARKMFTQTQTHKDRVSRWQTMEGAFTITDKNMLSGRHILLIDDIITTGATLEACGQELLNIAGVKLSVATVAYTL